MEEDESRLSRYTIWLAKSRSGQAVFPKHAIKAVTLFMLFTHALYWATAWWSPIPYILFMLHGFWVGGGIFKPWETIIAQATEAHWNPVLLKIGIPFMVINWVAIFACLYMFGTVVDSNGVPIEGTWEHFYFSAVTLTTLGYGTVVPGNTYAEIVATIEALIGFMGFAVLAGVVVSITLRRFDSK